MLIARSARRLYHSYQAARFQSTSRHDGAVKPPVLHLERQPQPTVTTDDCHRTLRARQHGNRDLPLPPLLDEKVIAAKQKFTRPKAPEHEGEPTEFQQRLAANVYAQVVATKVRQCHLTRARLPVFFLQPFTAHITSSADTSSDTPPKAANRPIRVALEPRPRYSFPSNSVIPASTYVISTKPMIEYLGQKRTWGRIVDQRMQDHYVKRIGKKDAKKVDVSKEWKWDAGMPGIVLHQLRHTVYRELAGAHEDYTNLAYLPGRGHTLIEPMPKRGERDNIAGVMVRSAADMPDLDNLEDEELVGVLKRGPVYVLQDLLDLDGYNTVCEQFDFRDKDSMWAIFSSVEGFWGASGSLLAALHRLQIYIGRDFEAEREKGEQNKPEILTGSLNMT